MRTKLPNWNRDPFHKLSKKDKKFWKELLKDSDNELRDKNGNGPFSLGVPKRLSGRMVEPESMTRQRRKRNCPRLYMEPSPKMEPPRIYRGRGRVMRLNRDRDVSFKDTLTILFFKIQN